MKKILFFFILIFNYSFAQECANDATKFAARKYKEMVGTKIHLYPDSKKEKYAYIESITLTNERCGVFITISHKDKKQQFKDYYFYELIIYVEKDNIIRRYKVTRDMILEQYNKEDSIGTFLYKLIHDKYMFTYDEDSDSIVIVSFF